MRLTNEQIQQYISELPDNIKKVVVQFDWAGETMDIARTYNIQIDDIDEFRQETLKVILGLSPAEDFEKNIITAMSIDRSTAKLLVDEANERIFAELQRRAFPDDVIAKSLSRAIAKEPEAISEIASSLAMTNDDPYHEPISHADVRDIMSDEGVHLIDHEDVVGNIIDTVITNDSETISDFRDHVVVPPRNDDNSLYLEPIEEKDLRGANKQRIDTSILKTQHQSQPEIILSNDDSQKNHSAASKNKKQSLDQHIMNEQFITQKDIVDVSPNENEVIGEDGSFLEHLSGQDKI